MSGFTPGPWESARADECWHIEDAMGYRVAHVIDANGYPQNDGNARLIAAAPELLEALVELSDWVNRAIVPNYTDRKPMPANCAKALSASAAAIRKATGASE